MRQKLTKRVVDAAQSEATEYFVWDSEVKGFGLRVRPSGTKSYVFSYRLGGRDAPKQRLSLGTPATLTPAEARDRAIQAKSEVSAGRSPTAFRDAARRAAAERRAEPTVAELADRFLEECAAKLKPSTVSGYRSLLGCTLAQRGPHKGAERAGPVRQAFGPCKVSELSRDQVARWHLSQHKHPYQANRGLAALSALFTFAEERGLRQQETNPCRRVRPYREERRERYLDAAEYAALGAALDQARTIGLPAPPQQQKRRRATDATAKHRAKTFGALTRANPVGVAAIEFLLFTGWRAREALTLRWSDIDWQRGVALLPSTKVGRSERPLGSIPLKILESVRSLREVGNPYVFPGAKPGTHFTDITRIWNGVRHAAGLDFEESGKPRVRLHDLRHAVASVSGSTGHSLTETGALLGHRDHASTARYTHVHREAQARVADDVANAIQALIDHGRATPTPDVTPLHASSRRRSARKNGLARKAVSRTQANQG